jgi:DNA-binding transcriptional regulator YhcF (GntR family)
MENESLERPNYFAIIPADVRYSEMLSASAKLMYGEITSLANKTGTCWASNKYFADLYKTSVNTISRWVSELEAAGFITTKINKAMGNRRYIRLSSDVTIHKNDDTYPQKAHVNNNKTNNKNINKKVEATKSQLEELIALVNPKEKATEDRLRLLSARLKEYSFGEIINAAHAFSRSEWHRENGQMSIDNLLRPSKFGRWYAEGVNLKPAQKLTDEQKRADFERERREQEDKNKNRDWGF